MDATINNGILKANANAYRGQAWIATITGPDAQYGLCRAWLPKRDVTRTGNVYRDLEWCRRVEDGTLLEWSHQATSGRQDRGFWVVTDGQLVDVQIDEVTRRVEAVAAK